MWNRALYLSFLFVLWTFYISPAVSSEDGLLSEHESFSAPRLMLVAGADEDRDSDTLPLRRTDHVLPERYPAALNDHIEKLAFTERRNVPLVIASLVPPFFAIGAYGAAFLYWGGDALEIPPSGFTSTVIIIAFYTLKYPSASAQIYERFNALYKGAKKVLYWLWKKSTQCCRTWNQNEGEGARLIAPALEQEKVLLTQYGKVRLAFKGVAVGASALEMTRVLSLIMYPEICYRGFFEDIFTACFALYRGDTFYREATLWSEKTVNRYTQGGNPNVRNIRKQFVHLLKECQRKIRQSREDERVLDILPQRGEDLNGIERLAAMPGQLPTETQPRQYKPPSKLSKAISFVSNGISGFGKFALPFVAQGLYTLLATTSWSADPNTLPQCQDTSNSTTLSYSNSTMLPTSDANPAVIKGMVVLTVTTVVTSVLVWQRVTRYIKGWRQIFTSDAYASHSKTRRGIDIVHSVVGPALAGGMIAYAYKPISAYFPYPFNIVFLVMLGIEEAAFETNTYRESAQEAFTGLLNVYAKSTPETQKQRIHDFIGRVILMVKQLPDQVLLTIAAQPGIKEKIEAFNAKAKRE